jgi:hypothetical protein
MAEQPRLDVLGPERRTEERILTEIDLADREIVRRPPVAVDLRELVLHARPGLSQRTK